MLAVYIAGIVGMLRTDKLDIPTLQCLTCDDEQAGDTKSLTLHLQEVILTTMSQKFANDAKYSF